jgi:hypothetical protein
MCIFKLETRNVIICSNSKDEAHAFARSEQIEMYYHIDNIDQFKDWGLVNGFNKYNTVIWLIENGKLHPSYVRLRNIADMFSLEVINVDTNKKYLNIIENTNTIH